MTAETPSRRRRSAVVAAFVAVAGVLLAWPGTSGSGVPAAGSLPTPDPAGGAGCPGAFPITGAIPARTRVGELVPAGATGARVCRYFTGEPAAAAPLTGTLGLKRPVGDLVAALNGLPDAPPAEVPDRFTGDIPTVACGLINLESYAIVFTYPGRQHAIVWVDTDCGVILRDGNVRFDRALVADRAYW